MKINRDNEDWIGQVRNSLNSYEPAPPADGWSRLEKELALAEAPQVSLVPIWVKRSLSIAAVLVCVLTAGALLWSDAIIPLPQGDIERVAISSTQPMSDELLKSDVERIILDHMNDAEGEAIFSNDKIVASLVKVSTTSMAVDESDIDMISVASSDVHEQDKLSDLATEQWVETTTPPQGNPASRSENKKSSVYSNDNSAPVYDWDKLVPTKRAKRGGGVSLFAGGASSQSSGEAQQTLHSAMINNGELISGDRAIVNLDHLYDTYAYKHNQPLSFGATVRKELPYGLSLETGLVYTYLKSEVTMIANTPSVDQSLHFLGVPLRLDWTFLNRSNFTMYLGGGGMVEKCLSAKFGPDMISEKSVQFSMFGAVGAQYNLGDHIGLYFEPKISHYFTDTNLRTIRTDSDVDLTLQLGVRFRY